MFQKEKPIGTRRERQAKKPRPLDPIVDMVRRDGLFGKPVLEVDVKLPSQPDNILFNLATQGMTKRARKLARKMARAHMSLDSKPDLFGKTALITATQNGHATIVSLLIDLGADVNKYDTQKCTALMAAAANGNAKMVSLLLAAGADASLTDHLGSIALYRATMGGHLDCVKLLLPKLNLTLRNNHGYTPLHVVASHDTKGSSVKLLAEAGADINAKDNAGYTPLMLAAINNRINSVMMLISLGADAKAYNNSLKNAYDLALAEGHREITALLRDQGAKE